MASQIAPIAATEGPDFVPANVTVRTKISGLWTAMLFVFAYVDLFSLYRADIRTQLEAGELAGFRIGQTFLLGTTVFIVIPSLMVFFTLILRPRANRWVNIALSTLYVLATVGAAIGEAWGYYLLGTAVEVVLLLAIAYYAWTWPRKTGSHSR